jgi:hypothetical protein
MRAPWITLSLSAALACALVSPAQADDASVRDTLAKAKLIGVWARDCKSPPGPDNGYETIAVESDGAVMSRYDTGTGETSDYRFLDARINKRGDVITLERWLGNGGLNDVVYRIEGDRQTTWANLDEEDEKVLVADGKFTVNSETNPWYYRCKS